MLYTKYGSESCTPELQADVHAVGALIARELDESLLVLESHRNREVVNGTALDDTSDVLCK